MKILVIVTSHFGYDGITNVATNYYTYIEHSKVQMDFVTINEIPDNLKRLLDKNGDTRYVLPMRNQNPLSYLLNLIKIIKKGKYDIVHIHGNSNTMFLELWAAKLAGVKVRIPHSHNTKCDHPVINKLLKPFFRAASTYGFACGKEAGEWLFPKDSFKIIPNGIDLERFNFNQEKRDSLRKEMQLQDKLVVGHVGRFSLQKNHEKLLRIFAALKQKNLNVTLMLWGEGELMEATKQFAQQTGGDIRFMGTTNKVEEALQVVDIIVFPSLFEGLPLFLVEAQAMGLNCLVSDTVSPMAKLTNYFAFQPLNDKEEMWAETIIKMCKRTDSKHNSKVAHEFIAKAGYDIRENCNNLLETYKSLIK